MKIKKYFLLFAFCAVSIIALLYGVSPQWFAKTLLNVPVMPLDYAHILRAVMCLYLALGLFWLFSALLEGDDPLLVAVEDLIQEGQPIRAGSLGIELVWQAIRGKPLRCVGQQRH